MAETSVAAVAIRGDPISGALCRFIVDRPVYPNRSFYFGNKEQARGSPLAEPLFEIDGVTAVLISHDQVTVTKASSEDWPVVGKRIGQVIRAHMETGAAAVADFVWQRVPPAEEIRSRVQEVLTQQINPGVSAHGGLVRLLDVKDNAVYIQMGGGCQGCGMADVTLKQGIEKAIRFAVPEVGDILDVTDHAAGRNPYYTPSKK